MAQTAAASIRNSDIMVRFGGEEFIILLPRTAIDGGVAVAEKIRKSIESNNHPIAGRQTASFGVAERAERESFAHWYQRLDEALYHAKTVGRNRVIAADFYENQDASAVFIEWKKEWECGFKQIDDQHKELVEAANGLIYLSLPNADLEKTMCQMDVLIEHCRRHFENEEMIIAGAGYPNFQEHKEIHKGLINKAVSIGELCRKGELKTSALLLFIFDDIILLHMVREDKKFFPYVEKYIEP
jgi:hemerythrin-like metal-binding protein